MKASQMFGLALKKKRPAANRPAEGRPVERTSQTRHRLRPRLESLEDRVLPTVIDLSTAPGLMGIIGGALFTGGTRGNTSGSGVINSFVRLQHNGVEQGFNTDARPYTSPNDAGTTATFNHAVQLHSLPVVVKGGTTFYEFALDINQQSSSPLLSLDELRIYVSLSNTLDGYDPGTGQLHGLTPVYDMDGGLDPNDETYVKLNSGFTSGSGNGIDVFLDVPTSVFGTDLSQYVYLYSKFGVQNLNPGDTTGSANSGYEEWACGQGAPLQLSAQVSISIDENSPDMRTGVTAVPHNAVVHGTASVTPASGTITPTGTVIYYFYDTSDPVLGVTTPVLTWPHHAVLSGGMVPQSPDTDPLPAGNYSFIATYSGDDTYVGTVSGVESLTVLPPVEAHFSIDGPSNRQHAGYPFTITVTARDAANNILTDYVGTVHFSCSDGAAVLPVDYTFTTPDHGVHSFNVTLQTVGPQTLSVTDTTNSAVTGSLSVLVDELIPGLHFTLIPSVTSTPAGTPFSATVTAYDENNHVATAYRGTVHFTTGDGGPGVVLPGDYTFSAGDNGVHVFQGVTLVTAGPQVLSVEDTAFTPPLGASATVTVIPGAATALSLFGFPSPVTAGTAGLFTVSARDAYGNLATGYSGTVHFTSSDSQAGLPTDLQLTNGIGSFTAILKTVGTQSLTATDTTNASLTSTQAGIVVLPAAESTLWVMGFPSPTAEGAVGSFTVTVLDGYGNIETNYQGTVHFSSSDGQATLPADYTFTTADAGVHSFTAAFNTAGQQDIIATDIHHPALQGSETIEVLPPVIAHFSIDGPSNPQHAGYPFTITVTARDAADNILTDYTGTVHFSCSDGAAVLPVDYTFTTQDHGVHSFNVTLQTVGPQTLSVTDTTNSAVTGSLSVLVDDLLPGLHFSLIPSVTSTPAGTPFSATVTAYDENNRVATAYRGTVHFTTGDGGPGVVLPRDYTFSAGDNGVHVFQGVTLVTAGPQVLSVDDTAFTPPLGASATVTVIPGAATALSLFGFPSPVTAGTAGLFTVSARDAYGNLATGYSGTVHFTSSDSQAGLPSDVQLTNGIGSFTTILKTVGTQSLTATDTTDASLTSTQMGIVVIPAAATMLWVTGFPSPTTAGVPGKFAVTAMDAYGNVATSYAGTVRFSSSDSQAALPGGATLVNGVATFQLTFYRAGVQTLTATDTTAASLTGTQSGITVRPAAANSFAVTGFPSPLMAGVTGTFRVTALDAFGNVADGYTGSLRFSSSDAQASLPSSLMLQGGTGTFSATLKTAGRQSLTVTDTNFAAITGTQGGISITSAAATRFRLTSPQTATAGSTFWVSLSALDSFSNTASGYRGTVRFTSSDGRAALPSDYAFTTGDAGVANFIVTLKTAGNQNITATDNTNGLGSIDTDIAVSSAALAQLILTGYESSRTAGTATSFTVTAEDAYGNTVSSYTGTVFFSSSDAQALLPAPYTFRATDDGAHAFTATLKTAGAQSLTATDNGNNVVVTGDISVAPGPFSQLSVAGFPSAATAGIPISFTVAPKDAYGNTVTGYTSTVVFTSTDAKAVLPAPYTFSAAQDGAHRFTATLQTTGTQTVGVIDAANSFSATQGGITVSPVDIGKLYLFAPNLVSIQSGSLTGDSAYIAALYQDLLNRPVDSAGLNHWVQLLMAGFSRQQLAMAIWQSAEHRGVEIDQYYAAFLGRSADASGRMAWVNAFLAGATEVDIMRDFLTSSEYQTAHPSDASFVNGLYTQVLGRSADQAGQAALLQALQGGLTRQALAQAVLTSAEADQRAVDQYYMLFLNRPADPAGLQTWTDLLVSGRATRESVAETILASDEYFSHAAGG